MTNRRINTASAESIRVMRPLFQAEESGSIPTSALQLWFTPISHQTFKALNRVWHSRLPLIGSSAGRAYYGAEFQGRLYAVAMWSNPIARLLPQTTWLELRRFAIASDAPRNTASRMLGWMVRELRRRFPEVVRLISYQDSDAHTGTIYRASGWTQATNYKSRSRGWTGEGWNTKNDQGAQIKHRHQECAGKNSSHPDKP